MPGRAPRTRQSEAQSVNPGADSEREYRRTKARRFASRGHSGGAESFLRISSDPSRSHDGACPRLLRLLLYPRSLHLHGQPDLRLQKLLFPETFAVTSPPTGDELIFHDAGGRNVRRYLSSAAMAAMQVFIGGTRLAFSLPIYALLGLGGLLAIFSLRQVKPSPDRICLWSSALFLVMFSCGPGSRPCLISRGLISFRFSVGSSFT